MSDFGSVQETGQVDFDFDAIRQQLDEVAAQFSTPWYLAWYEKIFLFVFGFFWYLATIIFFVAALLIVAPILGFLGAAADLFEKIQGWIE